MVSRRESNINDDLYQRSVLAACRNVNRIKPVACAVIGLSLMLASESRGQIIRLSPSDTTAGNYFGTSVAIHDSLAIVGASGHSECGQNSGAAFVYEMDSSSHWSEVARLMPDDCKDGLFFGKAVAISGNRAAIVAYMPFFSGVKSNTVYIFERETVGGSWVQTAKLRQLPGQPEGAFAASISLDHDRLLITTSGDSKNHAYNGAAYIYEYSGTSWILKERLTGSLGTEAGVFGTSGALSGDRAIVSASTYLAEKPGSVYIFDRDPQTGVWSETGVIRGILDFFISVDVDGDRIIVGESRAGPRNTGRARIFEQSSDGQWKARKTLKPAAKYSQGGFGSMVSLRGDHALVVGFDEQLQMKFNIDRVVYVFEREPELNDWYQKHIIDLGDVAFGSSIDLDDRTALIGQTPDMAPGNAYVVKIN